MKAVIMAGGKGARLAPYTKILPKPLMPIGDLPILEVLLRQVKHAEITEIYLTVGHLSELLRAFFKDGKQWGLNIEYIYEDKPLGTVGALALIPNLNEPFLMMNGDVLTTLNLKDFIKYHFEQKALATIAAQKRKVNIDFGVIESNEKFEVTQYIEKPSFNYLVSMGVYIFDPSALSYIPKGERLDFPDLIKLLISANKKVATYPFEGYWQDLGRPDDYEQATKDFENMREQFLPEDNR